MAKEYIERSDILKKQRTLTEYDEGGWDAKVAVVEVDDILSIPVADVVEVKHGQWEKTEDDFYMGLTIVKCSVCREEWVFEDMSDVDGLNYHYCPNCGAKMDGGDSVD